MRNERYLPSGKETRQDTNTRFGTFLIKPDSERLFLVPQIMHDIEESGFQILFRKIEHVSADLTEKLYPEYVNDQNIMPAVKNLFTLGPSTLVIVSPALTGVNVFDEIKKAKGKAKQGGIRDKYILEYQEDLITRGLAGTDLYNEMAKNRLHAPDDDKQHTEFIRLFITQRDQMRIREYNSDLYRHIASKTGIW